MNNLEQGNVYQLGGAWLNDTGVFVPPDGKVVVAINVHTAATFTTLTPANDAGNNTYHIGRTVASVTNNSNNLTVEGNGTNAEALANSDSMVAGQWIYGRWSAVTLAGGQVFLYFGQA